MKRHAAVALLLLAACGSKQPSPKQTPDAAPVTVAVAPDAEPPYTPGPVAPMERSTDVAELRAQLEANPDEQTAILLHGQLATALYDQSCAAPQDGLCVSEVARPEKALPTCGGRTTDVTVVARSAEVMEVEEVVAGIRQLWGSGSALAEVPDPPGRADEPQIVANTWMAREVAAALILLGGMEVEALYALTPPVGLEFDVKASALKQKSLARFVAWLTDVTKAAHRAKDQLGLLEDDSFLEWAPEKQTESLLWVAVVGQRLVDALTTFEVPKNIAKNKKATAAFCEMMAKQAEPFRVSALYAWDACVQHAKEHGVTGPVFDTCYAHLPP